MWPLSLLRPGLPKAPLQRPSRTLFFWLVGTFLLTLLPHVSQFPIWLSVVIVAAIAFRSLLEWKRWPLPSTMFTGICAVALLAGIYLQYSALMGRVAGTAFMAGLLTIKFYEVRGPRDISLILFSSYFVVMSALLFSQALELFIYCLIMMWLLTGVLLRVHMGDTPDNRLLDMLRRSGWIFLQALPVTLILFFFLPRYTGRFPMTLGDSAIGLSDRIEPGSIAKLADNDATAMSVRFVDAKSIPLPDSMYWRALVLWKYEAGAWTAGPEFGNSAAEVARPSPNTEAVEQEVTIWPHNRKWLFALDYPISRATNWSGGTMNRLDEMSRSTILNGNILQLAGYNVVDHKERYQVKSDYFIADETLPGPERDIATDLPDIDPRVKALADQLHQGIHDGDTQGYIYAVYHFLRKEGFVYSSAPGPLGPNALANFLLVRKIGFCEHYASAFAVLMRLEHIPARVVVGYHGGEFNPYTKSYVVLQSNAHAWDEVWIESKKHWVREDPTMILSGGDAAQAMTPGSPENGASDKDALAVQFNNHRVTLLSSKSLPAWVRESITEMRLRRQQMESDWDDWVFSYDPDAQSRLAEFLAFGKKGPWGLIFVCVVAVGLSSGALALLFRQKKTLSPVESLYDKFCRDMTRRGAPREIWEGPLAYTNRLAETFPDKQRPIRDVGELVARNRYGSTPAKPSPAELDELLGLIAAPRGASSSRESR